MKERVYFVDDDTRFLQGLRRSLRSQDAEWEMSFHDDPNHVLESLKSGSDCVVIIDWQMPQMAGPEFCEQVRSSLESGAPDPYVILLTGRSDTDSLVEALGRGADDYISKPVNHRELVARIRAGIRLLASQRENRRLNDELKVLASTDYLTHAFNRREGHRILGNELVRVSRGLQALTIMLIDLDHFKDINDSLGHQAGDEALAHVAECIRRSSRVYDSLVRWGGEEFLLICPDESTVNAGGIAERMRSALADSPIVLRSPERLLRVTASFGVCTLEPGVSADIDTTLEAVDACLYEAKEQGRNRAVVRRIDNERPAGRPADALRRPPPRTA